MASVEGGVGGSCFFDGDCGGPLYCHVEGVGGKLIAKVDFAFVNFLFFSTRGDLLPDRLGHCGLGGRCCVSVVALVVFLFLFGSS